MCFYKQSPKVGIQYIKKKYPDIFFYIFDSCVQISNYILNAKLFLEKMSFIIIYFDSGVSFSMLQLEQ